MADRWLVTCHYSSYYFRVYIEIDNSNTTLDREHVFLHTTESTQHPSRFRRPQQLISSGPTLPFLEDVDTQAQLQFDLGFEEVKKTCPHTSYTCCQTDYIQPSRVGTVEICFLLLIIIIIIIIIFFLLLFKWFPCGTVQGAMPYGCIVYLHIKWIRKNNSGKRSRNLANIERTHLTLLGHYNILDHVVNNYVKCVIYNDYALDTHEWTIFIFIFVITNIHYRCCGDSI